MFGRLLGWYTIYTFSVALASWGNFARCKIHFTSKCSVLLYWQRYCSAVQQRASAKLCGVVQGMELRNFRRRRHLYSPGRRSRWASAHILVLIIFTARRYASAVCVMASVCPSVSSSKAGVPSKWLDISSDKEVRDSQGTLIFWR